MYCPSSPVRRVWAPRCMESTPLRRKTFGIWYCGVDVVLPKALIPVMLNFDHPPLIDGESGRFGMPSSLPGLGDPKFGGKTLAPSRVYAARISRSEVELRLSVFPNTAFWPR